MQSTPQRNCPRNSRTYVWQSGDTLLSVAAANGLTPGAIAAVNPDADLDALQPGVLICLPLGSSDNGPVLDGTGSDTGVVTPQLPGGPVLDGTGSDTGVVTPQLPGGPVIIVQPGLACPTGYNAYTVRRGQTYADLLVDLNVSYNALRTSNPGLNPAALVAGTRFCAPPAGSRQICPRRTYRVQAGENLAALARRFGVTQGRLLMLNPCLLPTDFAEGALICTP